MPNMVKAIDSSDGGIGSHSITDTLEDGLQPQKLNKRHRRQLAKKAKMEAAEEATREAGILA